MPWIELSLDTTQEAVDWVRTLVADTINIDDILITGCSDLSDHNLAQSDWKFTIRLYLAHDVNSRLRVEKIINLLSPLHRTGLTTEIQTSVVEKKLTHVDVLQPIVHRIGKRFVVLTPDVAYEPQNADEVILRLKTSLSFGSGLHPATILSLKLIEQYIVPTMNVLDLGSGSGILSVAIAKLGATVLALDNDILAVQATQDAVNRNKVEQQVTVMEGSLGSGSDLGHWMGGDSINNVPKIEIREKFDLIVANILARMHIALANDYHQELRQNNAHSGLLITSGFTTDNEENVDKALKEVGFEFVDCERLGEWVALIHRLNVHNL